MKKLFWAAVVAGFIVLLATSSSWAAGSPLRVLDGLTGEHRLLLNYDDDLTLAAAEVLSYRWEQYDIALVYTSRVKWDEGIRWDGADLELSVTWQAWPEADVTLGTLWDFRRGIGAFVMIGYSW